MKIARITSPQKFEFLDVPEPEIGDTNNNISGGGQRSIIHRYDTADLSYPHCLR
jgi:hypothetical protein